jgi:DNA-binding beta-propeller fold protein YncE
MKTLLFGIVLLGAMQVAIAQTEEGSLYGNAEKAFAEKNFSEYVRLGGRLAQFSRNPYILFNLATAYTHISSPQDALKILHELAEKRLVFNLEADPVFQKLNGMEEYEKVKAKFKANAVPINKSDTAFMLSDPYLIPEGIAVDPRNGTFYISSLAKEKVVVKSGNKPERDFITSKQDGIWATLGMKVNPTTNQLWVCSSAEFGPEHGSSGIFSFDVKSGALKRKAILDPKKEQHLFNDVAFDNQNTVYFTDSKAGKLYRLKSGGELEELLSTFIYPNGVAIDEKGENLFVADYTGLTHIDLSTMKAEPMTSKGIEWLDGVDGLYYYKGSLIAVQGVGGPENDRIVKMKLNASNTMVSEVKILQTFRSDFRLPTTGTIYKDNFYYIANSYVRNLNPDGTVKHETESMNTIILKLPLE